MEFFVCPSAIEQVEAWIAEADVSIVPNVANLPDSTELPTVAIVDATEPKQECTIDKLYPEGRITCGIAFEVAARLDVDTLVLGKLLDRLKIKVKSCRLGCF